MVWRRLRSPVLGQDEQDLLYRVLTNIVLTRARLKRFGKIDQDFCLEEGCCWKRKLEGPVVEGVAGLGVAGGGRGSA